MIKEELSKLADQALLDSASPNEAITSVLLKTGKDFSKHTIDRICEMFNQKAFISKLARGEDPEENFPVADSKVVTASVLEKKIPQKKTAAFLGLEYYFEPITCIEKQASTQDTQRKYPQEDPNIYLGRVAFGITKYLSKIASNDIFLSEVKYTYPDSKLLKKLGWEKSRIPDRITSEIKEFGKYEELFTKLADGGTPQKKNEPTSVTEVVRDFATTTLPELMPRPIVTKYDEEHNLKGYPLNSIYGDIQYLPSMLSMYTMPGDPAYVPKMMPTDTNIFNSVLGFDPYRREQINKNYESQTQKMIAYIKARATIDTLLNKDDVLSNAEPNKVMEGYSMLLNVAPTLAVEEPLFVRNFLRTFTSLGGQSVDPETITALSKAETQYGTKNLSKEDRLKLYKKLF